MCSFPPPLVEKMERSSNPEETGLDIALNLIEEVKDLPGVSGLHIMSVGWESILPRLLREAGLTAEIPWQPTRGAQSVKHLGPAVRTASTLGTGQGNNGPH